MTIINATTPVTVTGLTPVTVTAPPVTVTAHPGHGDLQGTKGPGNQERDHRENISELTHAGSNPNESNENHPAAIEIDPHERFRHHGVDPAELIEADQNAIREHVTRWLTSLRPPWTRQALCIGEPLDWWFPGVGQRNDAAMGVCGLCPVREQCLDEALADDSLDHGIRGGATANARKLMRSTRRQHHPTGDGGTS